MMQPSEWNETMAPERPWQDAYPVLEGQVRMALDGDGHSWHSYSTSALMESLYPARFIRGNPAGQLARRRMFTGLFALENHGLARYVSIGAKDAKGRRPRTWRRPLDTEPVEPEVCPTCHQPLPL